MLVQRLVVENNHTKGVCPDKCGHASNTPQLEQVTWFPMLADRSPTLPSDASSASSAKLLYVVELLLCATADHAVLASSFQITQLLQDQ